MEIKYDQVVNWQVHTNKELMLMPQRLRVMGLDIASVNHGYCILDYKSPKDFEVISSGTIETPKPENVPHAEIHRATQLAVTCASMGFKEQAYLTVIEGYAYMNKFKLGELTTVGAIVRSVLYASKMNYIDVQPSMLKRFVTGIGNANKQKMVKLVSKQWGIPFTPQQHDEADAFALAMFGCLLLKRVECNQLQLEVTDNWIEKNVDDYEQVKNFFNSLT